MSFKAYLDNIKAKTGKDPEDFRVLAEAKGLLAPGVKTTQIVNWLKEDFGLGRGHAMAVVETLNAATQPPVSREERLERFFTGRRAQWRAAYDHLLSEVTAFGPGISAAPTDSYISLLRDGRKFGIVQITADRLDVGIKLKDVAADGRLEPAGDWNRMVTHRVRIGDAAELDGQVLSWLKQAFERA